ncbi:hypothetical protein BDA99DRAFT_143183 [Phascolomyces articulosus]|uniref:HIT-type domain-containing protein n=1 Tax=Phascolomyces articulosus TaxID=60185 RepID=A0AAD5PBL0_9FUNG|nr:hypothetical protein BDA99DRAFT_143183 [Phascolomyces articulosus]
MVLCGICSDQESKYKCPTCKIPYCSIACFKNHKLEPCQPVTETNESSSSILASSSESAERKQLPTDTADEDDTSRLTINQLTSLAHSSEVTKYLQDPQIRDWVTRIDRSNEPEKEIDIARAADPKLEEFIQLLLKTTGHEHH